MSATVDPKRATSRVSMGPFTAQESPSGVKLVLLTTLGLLFVTPVLHYIRGVLHRRNSHLRQDRVEIIVPAKDATIEYGPLVAHTQNDRSADEAPV